MNKRDLPPSQIVLDLVLKYSATMPKLGHAAVLSGSLVIAVKNHVDQFVSLSLPVHFDGEPFDGNATILPRFVLFKLGSTVWKLAPSILHDMLHAYITVIEVPEEVTWSTRT